MLFCWSRRASWYTTGRVSFGIALIIALHAPLTHAQGRHWTVRAGDALSLLADRFGVSVDELREWNQLNSDRIYIGQRLLVRTPPEQQATYHVAAGDTLSAIAVRFDLPLEDITRWNPELHPDRIVEGQSLRLGPHRYRRTHRVTRGETLLRIARRHHVTVRQLREWNPPLRRQQVLREGRRLTIYSPIPESTSVSIGRPYEGRLSNGVVARRHRGYVLRDRSRAFGTHETIRWLAEAFDTVLREHPDAPRVRVHDISQRRGGPMTGHRSHQSGRDVDISFFLRRGCSEEEGCPMLRANPHDLVIKPQWTLLYHWLVRDQLEAVFVDRSLHQALYEEAKQRGATRRELDRWFQYPGDGTSPGIIRHYRQHRDHLHVRFRCHDSDPACR